MAARDSPAKSGARSLARIRPSVVFITVKGISAGCSRFKNGRKAFFSCYSGYNQASLSSPGESGENRTDDALLAGKPINQVPPKTKPLAGQLSQENTVSGIFSKEVPYGTVFR